jgi:F0F1-type ATP synthase assembly protein I
MATGVSIESRGLEESSPAPDAPGWLRPADGSGDVRRLALRFALAQAGVTLIAALVSYGVSGRSAALSALLGGGISTAGSVAMALVAFRRRNGVSALHMLMGLFVGEAAKFAVVVALFVVVLTLVKVSPAPMFGAYVATFLVYWVVFAGQRDWRADARSGREIR